MSVLGALSGGESIHGGTYELHTIDRAIAILDAIGASNKPLRLSEIARRMGLHKSTAHRLLKVLERSSLINRTQDNRYHLGLKLYEFGSKAIEQIEFRSRFHQLCEQLSTEVGETVYLSVLQQTSIVYLDKFEPRSKLSLSSKTGTSRPVYCTSMGKAMLAFQPPDVAEQIISKIHFVPYTPKTLHTKEALRHTLEKVRRRGYAIDDQEGEMGLRCVGAPVLNDKSVAIAAVGISGYASRITPETVGRIADQLTRCCREISGTLTLQNLKGSFRVNSFVG